VKPFVTIVVTVNDTPLQLMGLLEGPHEGITIGAMVTGRIIVRSDVNQDNPVFRWHLAANLMNG